MRSERKDGKSLGTERRKPVFSVSGPAAAKLLQSCLTLCDPIDSSPPGFPVPRILQARILEWVNLRCTIY